MVKAAFNFFEMVWLQLVLPWRTWRAWRVKRCRGK